MSKSKSVTVKWPNGSRVYSEEDHGAEFLALAKDFVSKDPSRELVKGSVPAEETQPADVPAEPAVPADAPVAKPKRVRKAK